MRWATRFLMLNGIPATDQDRLGGGFPPPRAQNPSASCTFSNCF
eukprot:CAMPEP_0180479994 /NCGR_PEP_ID=MMETSP1036_2-20121128/33592_1 /TAXON_ID=632150 /ORGANISM="Azadinium spinosum, Strain 3D9" /LENGTH=43 /DNA_ID= /DNA_START= /DNA_END= /DNA_ORIENTATION=